MRGVAIVVAVLAAACTASESSDAPSADGSTTTQPRPARVEDVISRVVTDYVDDVERGDLAAADKIRCSNNKIAESDVGSTFADRVAEQLRQIGPLDGVEVTVVSEDDGVARVRAELQPSGDVVLLVVVRATDDPSDWQICDASTVEAQWNVANAFGHTEEPVEIAVDAVRGEVDSFVISGMTELQRGPARIGDDESARGAVDRYMRSFASAPNDERVLRVTLTAYDPPSQAGVDYLTIRDDLSLVAVRPIVVGGEPHAGFRYLAAAYTFLQSSDHGPYWDIAWIVTTDTVVAISEGPIWDADEPARVGEVAEQLRDRLIERLRTPNAQLN